MALQIRTPAELLEYFRVRREMADNQRLTAIFMDGDPHTSGMVYAWDEGIKAVEALIEHQKGEGDGRT